MPTKAIFCAKCGEEKPHDLTVDRNNELLAKCACGGIVKFATPASPAQLQEWIEAHNKANEPIVKREQQAARARKASEDALAGLT